mgnify:CR=1 FL=1|jgi:hypothetical protein
MTESFGAVIITRGAGSAQTGQAQGSENFDIGTKDSNGPQSSHQYS